MLLYSNMWILVMTLGPFFPIEKNIFAVLDSNCTCGFPPIHLISVSLSHDCLLKFCT